MYYLNYTLFIITYHGIFVKAYINAEKNVKAMPKYNRAFPQLFAKAYIMLAPKVIIIIINLKKSFGIIFCLIPSFSVKITIFILAIHFS